MNEFEIALWTAPLVAAIREVCPSVDGKALVFLVALVVACLISVGQVWTQGAGAIMTALAKAAVAAGIAFGGVSVTKSIVSKVGA